jgi:hypothetical protein
MPPRANVILAAKIGDFLSEPDGRSTSPNDARMIFAIYFQECLIALYAAEKRVPTI